MANFIGLKVKDEVYWKIAIDNHDDLKTYHESTINGNITKALRASNKSESLEDRNLNGLIESVAMRTGVSPLFAYADILTKKFETMSNLIDQGRTLLVNEKGGYGFLESMVSKDEDYYVHESDDFSFPTGNSFEPIDKPMIALENDMVNNEDYEATFGLTEDIHVITNVRNRDKNWLIKSILNSKDIYIISTLSDVDQFEELYKALGDKIKGKTFHLRLYEKNWKEVIDNIIKNDNYCSVKFY